MDATARIAGFFAAHAVWCVSSGETLIPILAYETQGGERKMERLVAEDVLSVVKAARARIESTPELERAVIIYDGYIELSSGKTDALIVEAVRCGAPIRAVALVVPYRHAASEAGFAVHKPKVTDLAEVVPDELDDIVVAFFEGVHEHSEGAAVWNAHLDESV